jgi:uncharacterized protein
LSRAALPPLRQDSHASESCSCGMASRPSPLTPSSSPRLTIQISGECIFHSRIGHFAPLRNGQGVVRELRNCSNISVVKTRFEWDPIKAASNLRKHGVSFPTAARVFADPCALVDQDRIENGEERWQAIGVVDGIVMLLVAHTVREQDKVEVICIISARLANRRERRRYEEENS